MTGSLHHGEGHAAADNLVPFLDQNVRDKGTGIGRDRVGHALFPVADHLQILFPQHNLNLWKKVLEVRRAAHVVSVTVGQQQMGRGKAALVDKIRHLLGIAAAVDHDAIFVVVPGNIAVGAQQPNVDNFQIHLG